MPYVLYSGLKGEYHVPAMLGFLRLLCANGQRGREGQGLRPNQCSVNFDDSRGVWFKQKTFSMYYRTFCILASKASAMYRYMEFPALSLSFVRGSGGEGGGGEGGRDNNFKCRFLVARTI